MLNGNAVVQLYSVWMKDLVDHRDLVEGDHVGKHFRWNLNVVFHEQVVVVVLSSLQHPLERVEDEKQGFGLVELYVQRNEGIAFNAANSNVYGRDLWQRAEIPETRKSSARRSVA